MEQAHIIFHLDLDNIDFTNATDETVESIANSIDNLEHRAILLDKWEKYKNEVN